MADHCFFLSPNGAAVHSPGREPWGSTNRHSNVDLAPEGRQKLCNARKFCRPSGAWVISQGLLRVSQGSRPGLRTTAPLIQTYVGPLANIRWSGSAFQTYVPPNFQRPKEAV